MTLKKIKDILNKLYEKFEKNKLYFKYVGPTKDVNFNEYTNYKELFNGLRNRSIKSDNAQEKQKELLKKNKQCRIGVKNPKKQKVVTNLDNFYQSRD